MLPISYWAPERPTLRFRLVCKEANTRSSLPMRLYPTASRVPCWAPSSSPPSCWERWPGVGARYRGVHQPGLRSNRRGAAGEGLGHVQPQSAGPGVADRGQRRRRRQLGGRSRWKSWTTSLRRSSRPAPPPGRTPCAWRVASSDGHPIEGSFTFTATGGCGRRDGGCRGSHDGHRPAGHHAGAAPAGRTRRSRSLERHGLRRRRASASWWPWA